VEGAVCGGSFSGASGPSDSSPRPLLKPETEEPPNDTRATPSDTCAQRRPGRECGAASEPHGHAREVRQVHGDFAAFDDAQRGG
jgi:hypothetical protein